MGEQPARDSGVGEFGGKAGLIQPGAEETGLRARSDGMPIGHELTPSEASSVLARAAGRPVHHKAGEDPVDDSGGVVVDPLTGREVVESGAPDYGAENVKVEGKWGKDHGLSDLKPK